MTEPKRRIMLISWKWRDFKKGGKVITNHLLQELNWDPEDNNIAKFKDVLFDEFIVCDPLPNGEKRPVKPESRVVRTSIGDEKHPVDLVAFGFLKSLVELYGDHDVELFVFLHRKDGFGDQEVKDILGNVKVSNCFLIGEGRDYIYYDRNRMQGLLGDHGRFIHNTARVDKPEIKVADTKKKQVFQPHFDKVWNYYKFEFYTKILELKEDLMTYLFIWEKDDKSAKRTEFREYLMADEKLYQRVNNFIGNSSLLLNGGEGKKLSDYESEDHKSYAFDDCRINLAKTENIDQEYDEVSKLLSSVFLNHGRKKSEAPIKVRKMLKQMNSKFNKLLKAFTPNT